MLHRDKMKIFLPLIRRNLSSLPSKGSPGCKGEDYSSGVMSSILVRTLPLVSKPHPNTAFHSISNARFTHFLIQPPLCSSDSSIFGRCFPVSNHQSISNQILRGSFASSRGFRKSVRRRSTGMKKTLKERQLELDVKICIEDEMPENPEIMDIAEMLRLNVPMAMKIAFDGLKDSVYKTRDVSINDMGKFEKVEISLLLCNDDFIQKLNKEWRDEDHATDVLSMSQHIPELDLPILMLGDIVISVETAARQAKERGHSLLDEIRILMVHGLLHLLGFDHELSDEAETEMEKEEELILLSLGWKGKGLIQSAHDAQNSGREETRNGNGISIVIISIFIFLLLMLFSMSFILKIIKKIGRMRMSTGEFQKKGRKRAVYAFIDQNLATSSVIMDGITCLCKTREGNLQKKFRPKCVQREIMPSVEELLATSEIQKLLFLHTTEGISSILRPHWSQAI